MAFGGLKKAKDRNGKSKIAQFAKLDMELIVILQTSSLSSRRRPSKRLVALAFATLDIRQTS